MIDVKPFLKYFSLYLIGNISCLITHKIFMYIYSVPYIDIILYCGTLYGITKMDTKHKKFRKNIF